MIVNGAIEEGQLVWGMTVPVQPYSYYDLSMWITNLSPGGGSSLTPWMKTKLQIKINNETVLNNWLIPNVSSSQGIWNQVPTQNWYSQNYTIATIEIYDLCTNADGNDFGLDDISFEYQYTNVVNAVDDVVTTCFETSIDFNPKLNDIISPPSLQSQVNLQITSQPSHGSLTHITGNNYRYTPDSGWSGTETITYMLTLGPNDATSYASITFTVYPRPQRIITQHACESFTWVEGTGQTYTQSNQYTYVKPNYDGCDSLLILDLTIHHAEEETLPAVTACDSYTWHGTTYTQSGTYNYETTTQWGCPLTQHLPLTIHYGDTVDYTVSACEQYTWHGQTYTQSNTYTYNTTNDFGCSRLERLHLTISDRYREVIPVEECDEYVWPRTGQIYTASTIDSVQVPGPQGGCDSTFVLNLTIHYSEVLAPEVVEACDYYDWHGTRYTQSGLYPYQTTNQYGCELTEQLQLTIHESETIPLSGITACDYYDWHGTRYTQSGVAIFDTINEFGCNLQYTLPLTINHGDTVTWEPVTECDSYLWYGQTITETNLYTHMSTTPEGCPRLERIFVTINHSVDTLLPPVTACDSYEWHGVEYTQTGYQTYETLGPTGCPYVERMLITINHSTGRDFYETSCEPYEWYDSIYYEPGTYYHNLTNSQGCDSTLVLHLEMGDTYISEEFQTGCDYYEWRDSTYYVAGDYEVLVESHDGCDSLFRLHLTIAPTYQIDTLVEECESYIWIDTVLTQSGVYERHFQSHDYCDSLVTLNLVIKEKLYGEFDQETCKPFTWNDITYYTDGDYEQTLEGSNGCDSIATMHLTFTEAITKRIERRSCRPIDWEEHHCDHDDDYVHVYHSEQGCDTIVTLHFTLGEIPVNEFDTIACDPFEWYGFQCIYYTPNGMTIFHTFLTPEECDSTVIKRVFLNVPDTSTQLIAACDYKEYNGQVFDRPGVYYVNEDTVFSHIGCDSIIYRTRIEIKDSSTLGQIVGLPNVFVASGLLSGTYRYEVDAEDLQGAVTWSLSNPEWQIIEAHDNYCIIYVATPGQATLTASFSVAECGEMERTFTINGQFYGIGEGGIPAVQVYPNPSQGMFHVEAEGIESIRVIDMLGQVLEVQKCGRTDSYDLNLSGYAPSVYLLEIETIFGKAKQRVTVCR